MVLQGVILPKLVKGGNTLVLGDKEYGLTWVDDNTMRLISNEDLHADTWKRAELPSAYKYFFRDFKP